MPPYKDIIVPELGMTTDEVAISDWLKRPGEAIKRGEKIIELSTDKASVDLEASDDGTLAEIVVEAGVTIPVGTVVGRLDLGGGLAAGGEPGAAAAQPSTRPGASVPDASAAQPRSPAARDGSVGLRGEHGTEGERIRATPVARRLARREGIDLREVVGSGPHGRIRRGDVELAQQRHVGVSTAPAEPAAPSVAAAAGASAVPPAGAGASIGSRSVRRIQLSARQRRLAVHMTRSAAIPQFSVARDIDLTAVLAVPRDPAGPSFSDVVIKAVAMTLVHHERLNASIEGEELLVWGEVNIGIAVAVGDDLYAPVIRDVARRPLAEIAAARRGLTARARAGSLTMADGADGTFMISNMGPLEVADVGAIITPPQVSVLGVGAPVERLVPVSGGTAVHRIASFRMTCDHRAANGAAAARFLNDLAQRMSNPFSIGES